MVVDSTVQELDMPEENIATLLCQLESHSVGLVREIGTKVYAACTVRSYGGLQQLKQAARDCPPLGAALFWGSLALPAHTASAPASCCGPRVPV